MLRSGITNKQRDSLNALMGLLVIIFVTFICVFALSKFFRSDDRSYINLIVDSFVSSLKVCAIIVLIYFFAAMIKRLVVGVK